MHKHLAELVFLAKFPIKTLQPFSMPCEPYKQRLAGHINFLGRFSAIFYGCTGAVLRGFDACFMISGLPR